jgi:GR25 family glycosyltransferase involved in LPS biosynthesis
MAGYGISYFDACQFDDADGFPNKGVRGCFNSHLTLLRKCARSVHPALIMEDDVFFQTDALAAASTLAVDLQTVEWDIVYFGSTTTGIRTHSGFAHYASTIDGSHCRAIKPHIAARLAGYMTERLTRPHGDPKGGKGHMDAAINDFRLMDPAIKTYVVHPRIALQFASRTDLGTDKWWDRMTLMRPAVEFARQMKSGT